MTITLQQAQASLREILRDSQPGAVIDIAEGERAIAKIIVQAPPLPARAPRFGTMRGSVLSMEHFDDPLEDFADYM